MGNKNNFLFFRTLLHGGSDKFDSIISNSILDLYQDTSKIYYDYILKCEQEKELEEIRKEEHDKYVEEITSMDLPMDWENYFESDEELDNVTCNTISDGLILSLTNLGKVDIEYIAKISNSELKTVIKELRGSIYQNPEKWNECFYKGWEESSEYLSGNIIKKLEIAIKENEKYNGYFENNVNALKSLVPKEYSDGEIYVTLGSPWVPNEVIYDFIHYLLGKPNSWTDIDVVHDNITGTWEIKNKFCYIDNFTNTITYGTPKISAIHIIERTLNMKNVVVTEEIECKHNKSGKKRVIDREGTLVAIEKQQEIIKKFKDWVWTNPYRKKLLRNTFDNLYGCIKKRVYNGNFLQFPGMNENVKLYGYQKDTVARIIFSPNTLLAHEVGAGKTYVMIAAAMELKRMGLSNKNMFVVPNNIIGEWSRIFKEIYPTSNVLVIEPKDFTPINRFKSLCDIKYGNYDGVIIGYGSYELIPLSNEYYNSTYNAKLKEIEDLEKQNISTYSLRAEKLRIEELLEKIKGLPDNEFTFDKLGISRLFIDEAHNFKNVPLYSKVNCVYGISTQGSKKCQDMLDKVRCVQNNGGGVVMATGTPITNSITDAFVMQNYLQSGELKLLDLNTFDSWVGMFAEKTSEFEIDVDTNSYRLATRFAKFHNLPQLTSLFGLIADFYCVDRTNDIPDCDGYIDIIVPKTNEFKDFLKEISNRADIVRHGKVSRKTDNMLKITTDGRKAALDLRLCDNKVKNVEKFKVFCCADEVYKLYLKTKDTLGTQLVFCDSSTPKEEFNLYDELRDILNKKGVPAEEIAYIHDATTEAQKIRLFKKVRNGEIRVLIGSTFKLGIGVNVQERLVAIHHLDIPWRPADMVQREGRMIRQGNTNQEVYLYRYITEGSFDAYSWQLLETKQRFISSILSGTMYNFDILDIDSTVLSYAEVKALAVGNPLIKERVELNNELSRLIMLQEKENSKQLLLSKELNEIPNLIKKNQELIDIAYLDLDYYKNNKIDYDTDFRKNARVIIFDEIQNGSFLLHEKEIMNYCGFKIIIPANMDSEKPYIYIKNIGKYKIEIGDSDRGVLVRIDNFLDSISNYIEKLNEEIEKLKVRRADIINEMENKKDFQDDILKLQNELNKIDMKLGIKNE